jgi:hypothetical protein
MVPMPRFTAFLLCGALIGVPVRGQETGRAPVAGLISELSGEASIGSPAGAIEKARRFDTLVAGQTLRMAPRSRALVVLAGGQRFELGPEARATLARDRLTATSGPIKELPALPTLPKLAALDDSRPQGPPGAVRLRGTDIGGLRPYHTVVASAPVTFSFQAVRDASRYAVEIEDDHGRVVLRREVDTAELTVPAGTLAPGAAYHWTVQTLDKVGTVARGASRFTTLSEEEGRRRDALRQALASQGTADEALLAEVDRRLGLYPEALRGFRAALAQHPGDPAILRAVQWLEAREASAQR